MSTTIDERVVEMRFDNKQFEQETKRTMSTLSKLKEALKIPGAEKALVGVDKAARNIHLEGIAAGVDLLTKRFSTFGIASMQIIQNVTNALTNKLAAAVNFVSDAIVSGGIRRAMNIENAHFQLQALLKDETKVQAVMDNAMESVDGTAYAYDEAAKAASMFAASGLQAGEEMLQALKGITGVAAMTNSDFESMSMIFTTVAGNGRLMGDQLLQLSSRGLNAASTLADYFKEVQGQSGMTEAEIREMVSKGKISFQDFSNAMSWAFGDSAKRANETFTGAMSNMKSALARIGAEFVSPLVEQNGEMVNLFNSLRIKINEVKAALAFNEQESALSGMTEKADVMIQTIADSVKEGKINFDMFTSAIIGSEKSEEQLARMNEKLAISFGSIAESGYASTDVLKEIKKNGIDAYAALVDYLNGVSKGTIKATGELKDSILELTNGAELSRDSVVRFAEEGKISFDIFNNAIVNYSGLAKTETKLTTEALKSMLLSVKESGGVTNDVLTQFKDNGINATMALRNYINGVTQGTIRASYSTKKEIEELSGGLEVTVKDIRKFAEEGKISFATFQSAMEKSFGSSKKLSKQFTDFVLDNLKALVKYIDGMDVTKPMEAFYNSIESVKNVVKGLLSVVKPVTAAFGQVFGGFSMDVVVDATSAIEKFTSKLKLSETGSENLQKAFKGVFDVVKALIDVFGKFVKTLNPSIKPLGDLGEGALGVAGSFGEMLSKFAEWLSTSEAVNKVINTSAKLFVVAKEKIKEFTAWISKSFNELKKSPVTKKVLDNLSKGFKTLGKGVKEFIKSFGDGLKEIPKFFSELFGGDSEGDVSGLKDGLGELQGAADGLTFEKPIAAFERLKNAAEKLGEILMGNKGINTFVTNINSFFDRMVDAFQAETLDERITMVTTTLDKFIAWIKKNMKPMFEDVTVGGVISAGSGIGMIYSIMRMAKAFESVANKIKTIPDMLGPIKSTLSAYQQDLKADKLIKIAGAIAILAGSLTIMSFADWDQIWKAAIALGAVAGVVLWASSKFLESTNRLKEIPDVLYQLAKGFKSGMKKLTRAVEIKALGSTIKDLGKTLIMLVGSLLGIVKMIKDDPKSFYEALDVVKIIGLVVAGIATVLLVMSGVFPASLSVKTAGVSGIILSVAGSLYVIVGALKKLFSMEIPSDWLAKLLLLKSMIVAVGGVALTLLAGDIAGSFFIGTTGGLKAVSPFLGVVGGLYLTVLALQKLFDLEIPSDAGTKMSIMQGLLAEFAFVVSGMSVLSKFTGGFGNDSGKTLLGFAAVLLALAWSVEKLSDIPGRKLTRAVLAMDGVIAALALVFSQMNGIGGEKDTGKSVLYMAAVIGAIAVSLGVLSMIPIELLAKACAALGSILLALALDFSKISKITKDASWKSVLSMVGMTIAITAELMFLSEQPWEGLLAGAAGLSAVLLAMAGAMKIISTVNQEISGETVAMMVLMIGEMAAISIALKFLATSPWEGLLAGATALSEVLLAMAGCFRIMSGVEIDYKPDTLAMFASLIAASAAITVELMFLSEQPWEGLLAGATALSEVLLAMAGVMVILTKAHTNVKTATDAALAFDAFVAIVAGLLVAFAGIDALVQEASGGKYSLEGLIDRGSGLLAKIGYALGDFVGSILGGIGAGVTSALPKMGEDLGAFMDNSKDFWPALAMIDKDATEAVSNLGAMLLMVTSAEILDGIAAFFTKGESLKQFGEELKLFAPPFVEFANAVRWIDPESVKGAAAAAEIMASLYDKLPTISGMSVLIFGVKKNISQFAAELKEFGPAIAEFADDVKDVTPEQVEGAANAAGIMAALYDDLPTIAGFSQMIFGTTKTLSQFGAELKTFGPDLAQFASDVSGVTEESVTGAANAAEVMATLADKMPSTDALWTALFGGAKISLSTFSADLISFGENMVKFTDSLKDFDSTNVQDTVDSFEALVDLSKYIEEKDTDASPITAFANSLKFMAVSAIDSFVEGFKESDDKAKTAVDGLIAVATQAVYDSAENMKKNSSLLGQVMAIAVAEGIGEKESLVTEKINELALGMLVTLETATVSSLFDQITQNALSGIVTAVTVKRPVIATAIRELGHTMTQTLKAALPQSTFNTIGQNAFQGLYNGIKARKDLIVTATRTIGQEIVNTAKTGLQASKFEPFGRNIPSGLISGLGTRKNLALTAVNSLCVELINKMKTSLPNSTFVTMGSNIAANLIAGINSQQEPVRAAAQNLVDIASKTMEGVAVSINDQMNAVTSSTEQTLTELNRTLQKPGTSKAAQNVGKNAVKGVGVGITHESKTVTKATEKVAKSIPKTMQKILEIHSPSRVMIELGEYITQGVAEGIGNKEIDIRDAVDNIVNAIMEGFDKIINSEIGEKISLAIAEGISNKQFEIEDAMDRIVNLVTEKMEKLKETINETMASIEDEYFGIEPDITPVVDTDKLDDIKDMVPTVGEPPVMNKPQTGTMNEPPVMNKTEFKQVLGEAIPPLIKEFVGAPIQAPNSPKYEGSPIAAPDLSAPLAPIQQDFSDAVKVSANNAKGVQEQVKYSQTQNSLENAAITKQLEDLNETLKHEGEPMPPMQNTFYITGDNPQEIAQEVSKILQQQVEREETKWA